MPLSLTYPGVYVEELPSGVRTVTGVSTSVTAFIGRCLRGATDQPITINSFADFERTFGGLWLNSKLSFAVNDFYRNGGSQAVIVRAYKTNKALITLNGPSGHKLVLEAVKDAELGNGLQVTVAGTSPQFTLTITDPSAPTETYSNKIIDDIATWLAASQLVTIKSNSIVPTERPNAVTNQSVDAPIKAKKSNIVLFQRATINISGSTSGQLVLEAVKGGELGNTLTAQVANASDANSSHFNLILTDTATSESQTIINLTVGVSSITSNLATIKSNSMVGRPANNTYTVTNTSNQLVLEAANPGSWGNNLAVAVNYNVASEVADNLGLPVTSLFNLIVKDKKTGVGETFNNLTVVDSPNRVDNVLANQSNLMRVKGSLPALRPDEIKDATGYKDAAVPTAYQADDGAALDTAAIKGIEANKTGIYALDKTDIFNLLCIPPYDANASDVTSAVIDPAVAYCKKRRAFFLIDAPSVWIDKNAAKAGIDTAVGTVSENAAIFFPRILQANPLHDNQIEEFAPCGVVAGIMARIDAERGIWKAPAGLEASLVGVTGLKVPLTDAENGELNPLGINCLRTMPAAGPVIWGSRTRKGNDQLASEWKYIPVRRLALYIEESLYRGIQWAVFEPNDEPLWRQLALNVDNFMHTLYRQGAFQGKTQKEAYFVKCDHETTTQTDIDLGIVNILVGFAPLKPAEFVVLKLQQIAGQTQS